MRKTVKKGKYKYDFKISNFKTECYYAPSTLLGAAQKLGQLEDIEEELGIDLITLFKALKNGIYIKKEDTKEAVLYYRLFLIRDDDLDSDQDYMLEYGNYDGYVYLKDYGKTWALTKEELL